MKIDLLSTLSRTFQLMSDDDDDSSDSNSSVTYGIAAIVLAGIALCTYCKFNRLQERRIQRLEAMQPLISDQNNATQSDV